MIEYEENPLKAVLGELVQDLVSSEELDPDRIIAVGRERRRRRRAAASVVGTAAVLLVAVGAGYAVQGHGTTLGTAGRPSASARVSTPATPRAQAAVTPPPGTLKGTVVSKGTTDGTSWEISAALDGYANGNTLPQFCLYVWTSNKTSDPTACEGPSQPDPVDPVAPNHPQVGDQLGTLPGSSTLAFAALYTSDVTELTVTYPGGVSLTLHPVSLAKGVSVTGVVMPKSGGATVLAGGPNGSYGPITLSLSPPV